MTRQQRPRGLLPSLLTASAVALLAPGLPSFVLGAGRPAERPRLRASLVAASEGSASSSPAIAAEDAKAQLMELLADATLAAEVLTPEGRPARGRVSEAILRLEALNPNSEPVYSEDLDGTWKVMYTGSFAPGLFPSPTRELAMFLYGGGYSLGNLLTSFAAGFWGQAVGVKQGPRSVRIQGGRDVDAKATIEVAGQTQTVSYAAELMPLSARRMSEEIQLMYDIYEYVLCVYIYIYNYNYTHILHTCIMLCNAVYVCIYIYIYIYNYIYTLYIYIYVWRRSSLGSLDVSQGEPLV